MGKIAQMVEQAPSNSLVILPFQGHHKPLAHFIPLHSLSQHTLPLFPHVILMIPHHHQTNRMIPHHHPTLQRSCRSGLTQEVISPQPELKGPLDECYNFLTAR